jgi:hypothetical protein
MAQTRVNNEFYASVMKWLYTCQIEITCFIIKVCHHQTPFCECVREVYILLTTHLIEFMYP